VTFVAGREIWKLQQIQRYTRANIRREKVPTINELEEKRSASFLGTLRETLEKGEYKRYDAVVDELLGAGYSATDISNAAMHLLSQETAREAEKILEDEPGRDRERRPYPKYENAGRGERREFRDFRSGGGGGGERPPYEPRPRAPFRQKPWGDRDTPARPVREKSFADRSEGQGRRAFADKPFHKKPYGQSFGTARPARPANRGPRTGPKEG
jgi:ATP-dependent RNA helicase DeaD